MDQPCLIIISAKPGGKQFTATPSRAFKEVAAVADAGGRYEIAGPQHGLNYITFYAMVPEISKETPVPIVERFRRDYTKDRLNGFQIFFFPASNASRGQEGRPGY